MDGSSGDRKKVCALMCPIASARAGKRGLRRSFEGEPLPPYVLGAMVFSSGLLIETALSPAGAPEVLNIKRHSNGTMMMVDWPCDARM